MAHLGSATPAYGRDYKSSREVYEAFEAGKDFLFGIYDQPANKESFMTIASVGSINIRYKQLREVVVLAWNAAGTVTVNGKRPTPKKVAAPVTPS